MIDGDYVQLIYLTSPLHDIGKVGIPDSVLLKPGRLTPEEFEVMKQHTLLGGETLKAVAQVAPDAQFLTMAQDIALSHHEHFNGKGYPYGLHGEQIPISGRIVALADVYDGYEQAGLQAGVRPPDRQANDCRRTGKRFDPDVVDAFSKRGIGIHHRGAAIQRSRRSPAAGTRRNAGAALPSRALLRLPASRSLRKAATLEASLPGAPGKFQQAENLPQTE